MLCPLSGCVIIFTENYNKIIITHSLTVTLTRRVTWNWPQPYRPGSNPSGHWQFPYWFLDNCRLTLPASDRIFNHTTAISYYLYSVRCFCRAARSTGRQVHSLQTFCEDHFHPCFWGSDQQTSWWHLDLVLFVRLLDLRDSCCLCCWNKP